MRELLKTNEVRRITLIEELTARTDSITLAELAEKLNFSESSIKEDIAYFRKNYTMFKIETSYQGVRIEFDQSSGLKTFYQSIIENSLAFNLIEAILYVEELSEEDIIERFFISKSTLYRLIKEINGVLLKHFDISLDMNPFRFVGSEKDIRYFYYVYFNERYSEHNWPLPLIEGESFDILLQELLSISGIKLNFSEYSHLKLITTVNFFRYKNNNLLEINSSDQSFMNNFNLLPEHTVILQPLEEKLDTKINKEAILQIFYNYINDDYSITYEDLIEKTKINEELEVSVTYLSEFIDLISKEFHLPVKSKEDILLNVTNAAYNERSKPYNQYILYNRMSLSVERFFKNFPSFSQKVGNGLKRYTELISVPLRDNSLSNLYIEFIYAWEGIIYELQRKWPQLKILVISDISYGHADTIKDILRFVYEDAVLVDIFVDYPISENDFNNKRYDIILTNFPYRELKDTRIIYIENIPTVKNLATIQNAVNEINLSKKTHDYYSN